MRSAQCGSASWRRRDAGRAVAWEIARVETGRPEWGIDIDEYDHSAGSELRRAARDLVHEGVLHRAGGRGARAFPRTRESASARPQARPLRAAGRALGSSVARGQTGRRRALERALAAAGRHRDDHGAPRGRDGEHGGGRGVRAGRSRGRSFRCLSRRSESRARHRRDGARRLAHRRAADRRWLDRARARAGCIGRGSGSAMQAPSSRAETSWTVRRCEPPWPIAIPSSIAPRSSRRAAAGIDFSARTSMARAR